MRQKRFVDCVSLKGRALKFDFYLKSHNVLVEIDGSQHWDVNNRRYCERVVRHDTIKNRYAQEKGIPLCRIRTCSPESKFLENLTHTVASTVSNTEGHYKTSLIAGTSESISATAQGSNAGREGVKSDMEGALRPTDNQQASARV